MKKKVIIFAALAIVIFSMLVLILLFANHLYCREFSKGIIIHEPTCTMEGELVRRCWLCGSDYSYTLPATGHNMVEVDEVNSTCTEEGHLSYSYCTKYDFHSPIIVTKPLGHRKVVIKGYEATCEHSGLTDGVICDTCGIILSPQREIDPLKHHEVIIKGYEATCENDGLTAGKKCSLCDKWLIEPEVISTKHHEVLVKGHEATCEKDGLTDGKQCSLCNKWIVEPEVIKATGHVTDDYGQIISATCIQDGKEYGKCCKLCGKKITQDKVIRSLGHEYKNGKCVYCGYLEIYSQAKYYYIDDNTCMFLSSNGTYTSDSYYYSIPEYSPDGHMVTEISEFAFYNDTNVTSISIPKTVTKIANKAFYNCCDLKRISLPASFSTKGYENFIYKCGTSSTDRFTFSFR